MARKAGQIGAKDVKAVKDYNKELQKNKNIIDDLVSKGNNLGKSLVAVGGAWKQSTHWSQQNLASAKAHSKTSGAILNYLKAGNKVQTAQSKVAKIQQSIDERNRKTKNSIFGAIKKTLNPQKAQLRFANLQEKKAKASLSFASGRVKFAKLLFIGKKSGLRSLYTRLFMHWV